ncbi:hypothetical protein FQN54_004987 [Arachnomyces sp. PD_36]|nr:hypothetical protein FQN54_004987 [Arachnomyces sp. PD_36]
MPVALSASDLTRQRLPDCVYETGRHTSTSAIHKDKFYTGSLAAWKNFEHEVRQNFQSANLHTCSLPMIYDDTGLDKDTNLHLEHFRCGEEISISGRFVQNALHVVSAVAKAKKFDLVFGDWKASDTSNGIKPMDEVYLAGLDENDEAVQHQKSIAKKVLASLVPDYCIIDNNDKARVVGEAKVPWVHEFDGWWKSFEDGDDEDIRQALGQIAYYMQKANLKYGFLTNYNFTFFLKQESLGETARLYCSQPIGHEAIGSELSVSVRQCLLHLMMEAKGQNMKGWHSLNESKTWALKQGRKEKRNVFLKRVKEALKNERKLASDTDGVTGLLTKLENMTLREEERRTRSSTEERSQSTASTRTTRSGRTVRIANDGEDA